MLKVFALIHALLPVAAIAFFLKGTFFPECNSPQCLKGLDELIYTGISLILWALLTLVLTIVYLLRKRSGKSSPYAWVVYASALLIGAGIVVAPFT